MYGIDCCVDTLTDIQIFNLALALLTGILCLIVGVGLLGWIWRVRSVKLFLKGFLITLIPVKLLLGFRELGNAYAIWFDYNNPPNSTLAWRIGLFFAIMAQILYIIYEARRAERKIKSYIIIVEDNETLARIYRRILEEAEYRSELATSGYDALTLMAWEMPNLVITDIKLPDTTGVELVNKMRRDGYAGPIISLSGYDMKPDANFVDNLQKPITKSDLLKAVAKQLKT